MTTHDTLMALADVYSFHRPGSERSDEARAALSTAIAELVAERDQIRADRDGLHKEWEAHFGERSFGEVLAELDALLEAVKSFHTWAYGQRKQQSKGGHASFDYMELREQMDIAEAAMKGTPT